MNSPSPEPARLDPLAVVAFALAVLLMIVPVEADILDPVFHRGRFGLAVLVAIFFFAIVFTPFFFQCIASAGIHWLGEGEAC